VADITCPVVNDKRDDGLVKLSPPEEMDSIEMLCALDPDKEKMRTRNGNTFFT